MVPNNYNEDFGLNSPIGKKALVIGGDLRQIYAAQKLSEVYDTELLGFSKKLSIPSCVKLRGNGENNAGEAALADILVLPLPVSTDGVNINAPFSNVFVTIESITALVKEKGMIFGGLIENELKLLLTERGFKVFDYFEREELNVLNAAVTAEGAVQIAMEESPETLFRQKILIAGFGRVGKSIAKILVGMSADVSVTSRSCADLAWGEIFGCKTFKLDKLDEKLGEFKLIFNTIPARIFGADTLKKISSEALLTDLASKPGGIDMDAAKTLGTKVIWALSLPGKAAPVTAGHIIAEAILNTCEEAFNFH